MILLRCKNKRAVNTETIVNNSEAVTQRYSVKKVFLGRILFLPRCFPVNFAKFLRISFLTEHLCRLLLTIVSVLTICNKCILFLPTYLHGCCLYLYLHYIMLLFVMVYFIKQSAQYVNIMCMFLYVIYVSLYVIIQLAYIL